MKAFYCKWWAQTRCLSYILIVADSHLWTLQVLDWSFYILVPLLLHGDSRWIPSSAPCRPETCSPHQLVGNALDFDSELCCLGSESGPGSVCRPAEQEAAASPVLWELFWIPQPHRTSAGCLPLQRCDSRCVCPRAACQCRPCPADSQTPARRPQLCRLWLCRSPPAETWCTKITHLLQSTFMGHKQQKPFISKECHFLWLFCGWWGDKNYKVQKLKVKKIKAERVTDEVRGRVLGFCSYSFLHIKSEQRYSYLFTIRGHMEL